MPTYRAFQVTGQRQFELVDRELVAPTPVMSGQSSKLRCLPQRRTWC